MDWTVVYDRSFISDLQEYYESDPSLAEEMAKRVKAIENDPLKGEIKMAHLSGCRGDHVARRYAVIYENSPHIIERELIDKIEQVYFRGITHHDNQADAIQTSDPIPPMTSFSLSLSYETGPTINSELRDFDGLHVQETSWENDGVKIEGQFRTEIKEDFEEIIPKYVDPELTAVSIDEFLPD